MKSTKFGGEIIQKNSRLSPVTSLRLQMTGESLISLYLNREITIEQFIELNHQQYLFEIYNKKPLPPEIQYDIFKLWGSQGKFDLIPNGWIILSNYSIFYMVMYYNFFKNTLSIGMIDNLLEKKLLTIILNGENVWWKLRGKKLILILDGKEISFDPFNFLKIYRILSYPKIIIPDDFIIFTRLLKKFKEFNQIEHFNKVAQFGTFIKRGELYVLMVNGKEDILI